jgi:hypothetical protein
MVETSMVAREERIRIMLSKEIVIKISPWVRSSRMARGSGMCTRFHISMKVLLCRQWIINMWNARTPHIHGGGVMRNLLMQLRSIMPQLTQPFMNTV